MKKGTLLRAGIIACTVIFMAAGIYGTARHIANEKKKRAALDQRLASASDILSSYDTLNASYINDTSYDGSEPIDPFIFSLPFKKTDAYIPNKSYIKTVPASHIMNCRDFTVAFYETLLGTGYRAISEDPKAFKDTVTGYFPADVRIKAETGELLTPEEFADNVSEWILKEEYQADVRFETADCLVYRDVYIYVRGKLEITPYHCKGSSVPVFVPAGMSLDGTGAYIAEAAIRRNDTNDGFYIAGYNIYPANKQKGE